MTATRVARPRPVQPHRDGMRGVLQDATTWVQRQHDMLFPQIDLAEEQQFSRQRTHLRQLISEGKQYEEALVQHTTSYTSDSFAHQIVGSRTPKSIADEIEDWSGRVRPVIVDSKLLTAKERTSLEPFPSQQFSPIKIEGFGPSVQGLLDLLENHLGLLKRLASLLGVST